jgi:MoxR-like ATPase
MRLPNSSPVSRAAGGLDDALQQINRVILGKDHAVRLALSCMLARGHLLIEDLPGVGKTILAHTLARVLGLEFRRIQFTSDLLPADIIGVSIYDQDDKTFRFTPGPVFTSVVLADEINRATPKTQSALLEAMEERQITADGVTHRLPEPFFVIATQNPRHQIGTFPLPESQLDRFHMRLRLGPLDRRAERTLLRSGDRRVLLQELDPVLDAARLLALQARAGEVRVGDALLDYVQDLLQAIRALTDGSGVSPRAGLALVRGAQAWALLAGRDMVVPDDVQAVLAAVVGHRLAGSDEEGPEAAAARVARLVESVPVP